jgi:hypothetical protein
MLASGGGAARAAGHRPPGIEAGGGAWGLDVAWDGTTPPLLRGTPTSLLLAFASTLLLGALLFSAGALPPSALRVLGVAAGQGALLATALAWAACDAPGARRRVTRLPVVLVVAAVVLAGVRPWGALAYLLVPATMALLARDGRLRSLGLGVPLTGRALLLGVLGGAFLGGHLLVCAARTFGYRLRTDDLGPALAGIAYDAGANLIAAECFFRGALFNRLARRWSFGPAAVVSTLACVLRYVVDPLLPKQVELVVGAIFYIALQSVVSAWLLWWSGSVLPGIASGLLFFAAYRLLGVT